MTVAVYAGSFDPITNGHIDIISRSLDVFDKVIVAIAINEAKTPLFSVQERLEVLNEIYSGHSRVQIDAFSGLLVDFLKRVNARVLIRGLRAVSDFEYEFQMAHMNQKLSPEVETLFLMTGQQYFYVSSRVVKEVARFGGDVTDLVPSAVRQRLLDKFGANTPGGSR